MTHSGGKPHTNVGDKGQRYEVTYHDPETNERKVFGWSATLKGVAALCSSIDKHPVMTEPSFRDRQRKSEEGGK